MSSKDLHEESSKTERAEPRFGSALKPLLGLFGEMVLETLRRHIADGMMEEDIEYADMAVQCGLMKYEPYDPEKHIEFNGAEWGLERGDMIYYWGKEA